MRLLPVLCTLLTPFVAYGQPRIDRFGVFEASFESAAGPPNPYVVISGHAAFLTPDGRTWTVPLFWDGQKTWKMRISPDVTGKWSFTVKSSDSALNGKSGSFECIESRRAGGLQVSRSNPSHFQRQAGQPVWFMGDTAWGYFTDSLQDKHHRPQAEHYARTRAAQGFNVIHCMLLSEQGVGNQNGLPFENIGAESINPAYWREVDRRLAFANRQGLTVGLAIAWADKRKVEPFAWRRFPNVAARKRYARYVAARYSAYDVYFLVSGEWHGEVRTRGDVTEEQIFGEFVEIGDALAAADPHDRMVGIHPMSAAGSVREYAAADWMSFADYQQNYRDLHARILLSRRLRGPVVNSEYGYYLRDQDGDGKPDKSNSYSAEDMRFASWDILMAGGYLVTGFGTTYFAGHRDPGPFDVDTTRNDDWEEQIANTRSFFGNLAWWNLVPADELIATQARRSPDRSIGSGGRGRELRPPLIAYWAMMDPGRTYLLYVRGTRLPVELDLGARPRAFAARQYNPRTGEFTALGQPAITATYKYAAPDEQDWVVLLEAK
jgi:hypothetical protein